MTNERYKKIVEEVAAIKEQRGKMYRTEPKDIVPIEILEAVALLKAYRGLEGIDIDKKIDEYRDLMNYSAFIIERLEDKKQSETKHVDVRSCMTSSQQTIATISGKCDCGDACTCTDGLDKCACDSRLETPSYEDDCDSRRG
jgi:hypothetical protein